MRRKRTLQILLFTKVRVFLRPLEPGEVSCRALDSTANAKPFVIEILQVVRKMLMLVVKITRHTKILLLLSLNNFECLECTRRNIFCLGCYLLQPSERAHVENLPQKFDKDIIECLKVARQFFVF